MSRLASSSSSLVMFAAIALAPRASFAQAKEYTVKKGDSCTSIVIAEYGDKRYVDLLHQGNPNLGPIPHLLKEGTVLTLLPKPTPSPDARLDFVRNKVEVAAPSPKPAHKDELLYRGNRVSTQEDSAADVLFVASKGLMRLSEHTLVIILDASKGAAGANVPRETTLVTGALRARLSDLAGGSETVNTPAGKVVIGAGESKLDVDSKKTARLAVYKGKSTLTSQKKTVTVPENFGAKAEVGKVPTDPKPLPGVPDWTPAPEAVTWVESGPGVARGKYAAASKGAEVASWHVQIARDSDFRQIVVDVRVPRSIDSIETKEVTEGPYYFRVSGIDPDTFEGPFSEVKRTHAGKLYWASVPGARGQGTIVPGPDLKCTVDGAPLSVPISAYASHRVQCTTNDGVQLPERVLAAMPKPPETPVPAVPTLVPTAPVPAKERAMLVPEFGVGATAHSPLVLTVGMGVRTPLDEGYLQVGARLGYETPLLNSSVSAPQFGNLDTKYNVGVVRAELPFMARFLKGKFGPTLTVGPTLLIQESTFELPSGDKPSGYALSIGLFGKAGFEYQAGPGALFADLGFRGGKTKTYDFANVAVQGVTFDLGYRFLLK